MSDSKQNVDPSEVRLIRLELKQQQIIKDLESSALTIQKQLDAKVDQVEFRPVKLLMFGLVGMVLSGFLAAIIALVFKQ